MIFRFKGALCQAVVLCLLVGPALAQPAPQCRGDAFPDGQVDIKDQVTVLASWGLRGRALKKVLPNRPDVDSDGDVDSADLTSVIALLGQPCKTCRNDLNDDGTVNAADLTYLLASDGLTGSALVSLLDEWGVNCKASYTASRKKRVSMSELKAVAGALANTLR